MSRLLMTDNRKAPRKQVLLAGRIVCNHATTFDCGVRNLSEYGACLRVWSSVGMFRPSYRS